MNRAEGWEDRLIEFIEARRNMPFEWGANDCASFAFLAVNLIVGRVVREIDWHNIHEAADQLDAFGGIEAVATAALGEPVDRRPRRGDVALVEQEKGRVGLMLAIGGGWMAGPGVERLEFKPVSEAIKIWRIGQSKN
jgi:hypothetical protein